MNTAKGAPAPGRMRPGESGSREQSWFRTRLALRLALPIDRAARLDASRLAWSALLAAIPITVWLAAPVRALGAAGVLGLACAAVPGVAATAWSAARLYDYRADTARALRQSGAEQRSALLMVAVRVALFAGAGALAGGACVIAFHPPLDRLLPRHSPLRPMLAAGGSDWSAALVSTVILAALGALLASSPVWRRLDARGRAACSAVAGFTETRLSAGWSHAVSMVRARSGERRGDCAPPAASQGSACDGSEP